MKDENILQYINEHIKEQQNDDIFGCVSNSGSKYVLLPFVLCGISRPAKSIEMLCSRVVDSLEHLVSICTHTLYKTKVYSQ